MRLLTIITPGFARWLLLVLTACCAGTDPLPAADGGAAPLPGPDLTGGKPLMEVLRDRRTTRQLKPDKLPPRVLANLLWAGFGVNRPQTGHRTAPSAMNSQEIDIYAAMPDALYLYQSKSNQLTKVLSTDLRSRASKAAFATNAPVVLIYVADLSRLTRARPDLKRSYATFDAGCICQNVYLYCASAGLGTVVFDLDRASLGKAMQLKPEQDVIMAQAVGYPVQPLD